MIVFTNLIIKAIGNKESQLQDLNYCIGNIPYPWGNPIERMRMRIAELLQERIADRVDGSRSKPPGFWTACV